MPFDIDSSSPQRAAADAVSVRARTGIAGLDDILGGGLPPGRLYLLDGVPGAGKTTLGLQFLLEGVARGERVLYVTLSETADELRASASAHGWSLEGIEILELSAIDQVREIDEPYTVFHPAEVELSQTIDTVLQMCDRVSPARVVFDSLSEMRLMARDPLRFRRQILSLKQFFASRACSVFLLDDRTAPEGDLQLQSIAHGVISLERIAMDYGAERRRLVVTKLRGLSFSGGYHDFRITTGGIVVYPRLHIDVETTPLVRDDLRSGSAELDAQLGGGIPDGASALIMGPAGTGKSVLCTQLVRAALARGDKVRIYLFDERVTMFRRRNASLQMSVDDAVADGRLLVQQIEPTTMSPGEFADQLRRAVDEDGVRMMVIDSLNGYMKAMPSERMLAVQVHELLSYLVSRGVTLLLTLVQSGVFGGPVDPTVDLSYLADVVVLLRYFEHAGEVRQAISVVKKRSGEHERAIRESRVAIGGLRVGAPLTEFQGVLLGVPEFLGSDTRLMESREHPAEPVPQL